MVYSAKVLDVIFLDEYEGSVKMQIAGRELYCWYQANEEFAEPYLKWRSTIQIDLWQTCHGDIEIVSSGELRCVNLPPTHGYQLCGRVIEVFDLRKFRIDCGDFQVDIYNHYETILSVGMYVKFHGEFQIYFPNTEYSYEKVGY